MTVHNNLSGLAIGINRFVFKTYHRTLSRQYGHSESCTIYRNPNYIHNIFFPYERDLNKFQIQSPDKGGLACKTTSAVDYKRKGERKKILKNKHNLPA